MVAADPPAFVSPDRASLAESYRPRRQQGFGTKTKQWEMDTVAMMTQATKADDGPLLLEFSKAGYARRKRPACSSRN